MLQVAFGGRSIVSDGATEYISDPIYYEPGFNIMHPLEIEVGVADRFYILIKKRSSTMDGHFSELFVSDLEVEIKDSTNGMNIPYSIKVSDVDDWNTDPSLSIPIFLDIINSIDLNNPVVRSRVIDCSIKDTTDNDFILFRAIISDEDKYFHYIPVETANMSARNTYTAIGRDIYIKVNNNSDNYIVFSPYAYLIERDKNNYDFSFPLNSVFYKRQNTFSNEDYDFSIYSYSHDFILEDLSVMNIPSYKKAGVVILDRMLYRHLIDAEENAYVEIQVNGKLSGISDIFKINFTV